MKQFKRAQVVILPIEGTNENSQLFLYPDNQLLKSPMGNQHLYIISDDEIKEEDWFINLSNNVVAQAHSWIYVSTCKKIIATTDKLSTDDTPKNTVGAIIGVEEMLPQPSQQFIERYIESYNKGKIITDVLKLAEPLLIPIP